MSSITVAHYGEDALLDTLTACVPSPHRAIGIGDDCAVLENGVLFKTDCLVEGVHFLPTDPFHLVGRKAVARVFSDFAAMGGAPDYLLVTLGIRADTKVEDLKELYRAMTELCCTWNCEIVGGETTSLPEGNSFFLSISATGHLLSSQPVLRSTAEAGDHLYVTGALGGSYHSGRHFSFEPRIREAQWLLKEARPHAMMDLSDGLAKDLPRLARASGLGYELNEAAIPRNEGCSLEQALGDGEDYELLFTLSPAQHAALQGAPFPWTQIGSLTREPPAKPLQGGWDHFR